MNTTRTFNKLFQGLRNNWEKINQLHQDMVMAKQKQDTLELASSLIVHSINTFRRAKDRGANVKGWTAERVLSENAAFREMCRGLRDREIWDSLKLYEQRFISTAVKIRTAKEKQKR